MPAKPQTRTVGDLLVLVVISAISCFFVFCLARDWWQAHLDTAIFDHECKYHVPCS
jgi:hypothetical protein